MMYTYQCRDIPNLYNDQSHKSKANAKRRWEEITM